ncbi:MAG TPA: hypothetical protein VKA27_06235, partial [Sunxiuqinia sp.]|nr:hypothetical protein [Sunxiuqinia sp.]
MKNKILLTLKVATILLGTLVLSNSCSDMFSDPMKDKETGKDLKLLLVDLNFFDTKFNFTFVDADTGNLIDDRTIGVFFAGDGANNLVDYNGNKAPSYSVSDGRLALALDPNITVSQDNPVDFKVYVGVQDGSYAGYPVEVSYTSKGEYDIVVQLFKTGKQAKRAVMNPGAEPFDVKFNGSLIQKSGDPVWDYTGNVTTMNGKTYYSVYTAWSGVTSQGTLSVDNFTADESLYSNWGLEGIYVLSDGLSNEFELTNDDVTLPANTVVAQVFSATQRNDVNKCADGINVEVSGKDNLTGTAKFNYKLLVDGEVVKTGKIGVASMPSTVSTGAFYYPGDATSATLVIDDDPQFTIEPHETTLSDICGGTVRVTATPKSGLAPYKIITTFVCP